MRHRTLGLAAVVLLAAPVMASCTQPPGGGGRPTTTTAPGGGGGVGQPIPGPVANQVDCGTINKADAATAAERDAASCFLQYHGYENRYLKVVNGASTIVLSAFNHGVTVTHATNGITTRQAFCQGSVGSQYSVDASGNVTGLFGNTCGL